MDGSHCFPLKKDQDDLLGAPITAEEFFGSISAVTQHFKLLKDHHYLPHDRVPRLKKDEVQHCSNTVWRKHLHSQVAPQTTSSNPDPDLTGLTGLMWLMHPVPEECSNSWHIMGRLSLGGSIPTAETAFSEPTCDVFVRFIHFLLLLRLFCVCNVCCCYPVVHNGHGFARNV